MHEARLESPVALFIFNRPETTRRVFEAVAAARPRVLLVVADGPRESHFEDDVRCAAAREVIERIDWPCELLKNYSIQNLGCRNRMSSGLDWVFSTVDSAIILEDDCLPHPTFFTFCDELLCLYRDNTRVMHIGGAKLATKLDSSYCSYYFSRYAHVWGWASWRRAWKKYDVEISEWRSLRESTWLENFIGDLGLARAWRKKFDSVGLKRFNTWDYQWLFALWRHQGLSIVPRQNLVTNVGFGWDATHTRLSSRWAALPASEMNFPLRHPERVERNAAADGALELEMFKLSLMQRVVDQLQGLPGLLRRGVS